MRALPTPGAVLALRDSGGEVTLRRFDGDPLQLGRTARVEFPQAILAADASAAAVALGVERAGGFVVVVDSGGVSHIYGSPDGYARLMAEASAPVVSAALGLAALRRGERRAHRWTPPAIVCLRRGRRHEREAAAATRNGAVVLRARHRGRQLMVIAGPLAALAGFQGLEDEVALPPERELGVHCEYAMQRWLAEQAALPTGR